MALGLKGAVDALCQLMPESRLTKGEIIPVCRLHRKTLSNLPACKGNLVAQQARRTSAMQKLLHLLLSKPLQVGDSLLTLVEIDAKPTNRSYIWPCWLALPCAFAEKACNCKVTGIQSAGIVISVVRNFSLLKEQCSEHCLSCRPKMATLLAWLNQCITGVYLMFSNQSQPWIAYVNGAIGSIEVPMSDAAHLHQAATYAQRHACESKHNRSSQSSKQQLLGLIVDDTELAVHAQYNCQGCGEQVGLSLCVRKAETCWSLGHSHVEACGHFLCFCWVLVLLAAVQMQACISKIGKQLQA